MNPPFESRRDVLHVLHAHSLLAPAGRLVAVMAAGVKSREDRLTRELRELVLASPHGAITDNDPDAFRPSGTSVRTVTVTIGPR
jgi:hypothetical protein